MCIVPGGGDGGRVPVVGIGAGARAARAQGRPALAAPHRARHLRRDQGTVLILILSIYDVQGHCRREH